MTRVSPWDKHGVNPWQPLEDLTPFVKRELHGLRIGIVLIHGWIPDPDVQAILVAESRHADHRVDLRKRKVWAVGSVIRSGRNKLNSISPKGSEVANVLLPHRQGPAVVRVGFRAIAKLMPAQSIFWGCCDAQRRGYPNGIFC